MDASVATTELRIENGHVDSQSSLTNRLGHLAKRVPPPTIADVWLFPPLPDGESASCQLEGAVETGNIQFGFAEAASHGAQWVIQWLRGAKVPPSRTYTIHMGDLPLPQVTEEDQE